MLWEHPSTPTHICPLERSLKLDIKFKLHRLLYHVTSETQYMWCVAGERFVHQVQKVLTRGAAERAQRGQERFGIIFSPTNIRGNEFAKFFPFSHSWPPFFPQSLRALDSSISSPSPLTDCLNIYTGGSVCPEPFLKQPRPASSPPDLVHEEFRPKWILASSGSSCQELHSFHLTGVKRRFLPSVRAPSTTPGLHFVLLTLGGHSPLLSFSVALAVPFGLLFLLVVLQISMF